MAHRPTRLKRFCTSGLTCRCCQGGHQLRLLAPVLRQRWRQVLLLMLLLAVAVVAALPLIRHQRRAWSFPRIRCPDSSGPGGGIGDPAETSDPPHRLRVPLGNWSFMAPDRMTSVCGGRAHARQLLALVPVTSSMAAERQSLRRTWGSQLNSKYGQLLFLVQLPGGAPVDAQLQAEFDLFQDLLIAFHRGKHDEDTYGLLVRKVVAGIKWYSDSCRMGFNYLLKADHDSYWNVPSLLQLLQRHGPNEPLVFGSVQEGALVERDPSSKFFTPEELYPRPQFPPYASGGPGYALSRAAAVAISAEAFRAAPPDALWLEDVYVTGLLPESAFCTNRSRRAAGSFLHLHSDYIFICRYAELTPAVIHHWPPLAMHRVQGRSLEQLHAWMRLPGVAEKSSSKHSIVYSRSSCGAADF